MSIVTSMLEKLGFFGALRPWITALAPKFTVNPPEISLSFGRGGQWHSAGPAAKFRRSEFAQRGLNEIQGRLPVAR